MSDIAIKVEHVSKDFVLPHEKITSIKSAFTGMFNRDRVKEAQHALRDVGFEVKKGEFFGIVGRNGSGKSTMLKILAGIYQPTKGSVHTYGKLVPFIELGVGFNPELTGRENVFLNGAMLGFSRREVAAMYDDIVAFAELERFMDQKLKNYSSGMQVRLAFAMATRAEADILLVDEVLAVGDADFQRKCFNYFKTLKKNHKTVVFVSHDMDAVKEYCDRAILIEQNHILEAGSSQKVARAYAKLFAADVAPDGSTEKAQNRMGDQAIYTKSITAKATAQEITITQTVIAKDDVTGPVLGIRIRDAMGKDITGTNTKIEEHPAITLEKGVPKTVTWRLPNILSDGSYYVDPAILHNDGITVADWWDDAALLTVKKDRHVPYGVQPSFEVDIQ